CARGSGWTPDFW
nr:immunoglobulin heavy chain junction region [Macaca mulatta]MOV35745.1 immunoglobulin heavy chain junction region [Macaca mulatta]